MFDAEKLIHEVQLRDNLWNVTSKSYLDKAARRNAWQEIAKVFHHDWDDLPNAEKRKRVDDLMRKWRNVRDYYMKEKRRAAKSKSSGAKKKKKYNHYDCLSFLDIVIKEKRKANYSSSEEMKNNTEEYFEDTHTNDMISDEQCPDYDEEDTNESSSSGLREISPPIIKEEEGVMSSEPMPSFETHIIAPSDKPQDVDNVTANKNFLLSLLPDVTSLNESQNMRFRIGVLNLLNDIKFELK